MHDKKLAGKDWFCSWGDVLGIQLREREKQLCACVNLTVEDPVAQKG